MIQNIVILLLANTFIPMLPVPPEIIAPLPLAQIFYHQPSVYQYMNLSRVHTDSQFKKAFRESLKVLHPDRGGNPQAFARVKNLKKIMQTQHKAYDTLNVTDIDLEYGVKLQDAINIKQTAYYVQTGIFYFVILLYGLAFTIQDQLRPARKYILLSILIFGGYQMFIYLNPQSHTIIDLIYDKMPIFHQKAIIKQLLSLLVAVIRTRFMRTQTAQKKLFNKLQNNQDQGEFKTTLISLLAIYKEKAQNKQKNQQSWSTKIRKLISTCFTIFILYSIVTGFFSGDNSETNYRGL